MLNEIRNKLPKGYKLSFKQRFANEHEFDWLKLLKLNERPTLKSYKLPPRSVEKSFNSNNTRNNKINKQFLYNIEKPKKLRLNSFIKTGYTLIPEDVLPNHTLKNDNKNLTDYENYEYKDLENIKELNEKIKDNELKINLDDMIEIKKGLDLNEINEIKELIPENWIKLDKTNKDKWINKFKNDNIDLTIKQKLIINKLAQYSYDNMRKQFKGNKNVIGNNDYPPPLFLKSPPVVTFKAILELPIESIINHYNLDNKNIDILKQIVGPRYNVNKKILKLISRDESLDPIEHADLLSDLLINIIDESKN